jgi:hypothetical protein
MGMETKISVTFINQEHQTYVMNSPSKITVHENALLVSEKEKNIHGDLTTLAFPLRNVKSIRIVQRKE